jgi:hypothetical protein
VLVLYIRSSQKYLHLPGNFFQKLARVSSIEFYSKVQSKWVSACKERETLTGSPSVYNHKSQIYGNGNPKCVSTALLFLDRQAEISHSYKPETWVLILLDSRQASRQKWKFQPKTLRSWHNAGCWLFSEEGWVTDPKILGGTTGYRFCRSHRLNVSPSKQFLTARHAFHVTPCIHYKHHAQKDNYKKTNVVFM